MNFNGTVIFDLDGVLANTLSYLQHNYKHIVSKYGGQASDSEFEYLNGKNLNEICDHLLHTHQLGCTNEELFLEFQIAFSKLYEQAQLNEHAVKLLHQLQDANMAIGLATSAPRQQVVSFLEQQGIIRFFQHIITGSEVKRAKPQPDIYLEAKNKLPHPPHYVVEDALNGLDAADSAGMKAIHYNPANINNNYKQLPSIDCLSKVTGILFADLAQPKCTDSQLALHMEAETPNPNIHLHQQDIEAHWLAAQQNNPTLFNGQVVHYSNHSQDCNNKIKIHIQTSDYKSLLYQMNQRVELNIHPIAVSGVLIDQQNRVLVGKRSKWVSEYPNMYELVPSGGITPDYAQENQYIKQWQKELMEECGIENNQICTINTLGLYFDELHKVYDIAIRCTLKVAFHQLTLEANKEYSEFCTVSISQLNEFLSKNIFTPTSRAIANDLL